MTRAEIKGITQMSRHCFRMLVAAAMACVCSVSMAADAEQVLRDSLVFFAGFDGSLDAVVGNSRTFRTAESTRRQQVRAGNHSSVVTLAAGEGRFGDALRFSAVASEVVLFDGSNVGYRNTDWSATISFWLKLDPDADLAPGFCDPIQITDKTWNDSALWVDFDKVLPRAFRLGSFPRYAAWNPQDTPWEEVPAADRPLVTVKQPGFSRDRWTHVVMVVEGVNAAGQNPGSASLYLDGVLQGTTRRALPFDWEIENVAIMLGINYIGDFDELAVFDRPLNQQEVKTLLTLPAGVRGLLSEKQ
jgi:hypothetical protein